MGDHHLNPQSLCQGNLDSALRLQASPVLDRDEHTTMCDGQICRVIHANDALKLSQLNWSIGLLLLLFLDHSLLLSLLKILIFRIRFQMYQIHYLRLIYIMLLSRRRPGALWCSPSTWSASCEPDFRSSSFYTCACLPLSSWSHGEAGGRFGEVNYT